MVAKCRSTQRSPCRFRVVTALLLTLPSHGAESHDYVCEDVKPGAISREMLTARVSLITSAASGAQTLG